MGLEISSTFVVNASADRIWEIMVDEFTDVAAWASGLASSRPNPRAPGSDGTPEGRVCEVPGLGFTDERFTVFDPAGRTFGYSVDAEKVPSFLSGMTNVWTLRPLGPERTEVTQRLTAQVHGPVGAVLKPVMQRQFGKLLANVKDDLRAYAETGRVSPRKARELSAAAG